MDRITTTTVDVIPALLSLEDYARDYVDRFIAAHGFPPMAGGDGDDDEPDADGNVKVKKSDLDELKRTVANKDKEARQAKKDLTDLQSEVETIKTELTEAKAGGDEADKLERRLASVEKKAADADKRAADAEAKLESSTKSAKAVSIAARLKFRNPERAIKLLDPDDLETDADAERALEALAREEPYLVTSKRQRQVDDPKPKGDDDVDPDEDPDEPKKPDKDEDEPTGPARIKSYYAEQAKKAEKAEREAAANAS